VRDPRLARRRLMREERWFQVYKVVWFARFLEGMDKHEARRYRRREVHGPLGLDVPQIKACVQSHAVAALGPAGETDGPNRCKSRRLPSCWRESSRKPKPASSTTETDGRPSTCPVSQAGSPPSLRRRASKDVSSR
jgi:hypothetical protein